MKCRYISSFHKCKKTKITSVFSQLFSAGQQTCLVAWTLLIFTFSGTQIRIADHEHLQSWLQRYTSWHIHRIQNSVRHYVKQLWLIISPKLDSWIVMSNLMHFTCMWHVVYLSQESPAYVRWLEERLCVMTVITCAPSPLHRTSSPQRSSTEGLWWWTCLASACQPSSADNLNMRSTTSQECVYYRIEHHLNITNKINNKYLIYLLILSNCFFH